jgi:Cu-Zn family superoxide dismutase
MKKGMVVAVAALTATAAALAACNKQNTSGPNTSPMTSAPADSARMTTQLKSADGTAVANATFDFANNYATVTVEAGPNQILSPGFRGLQIHSVGSCEPNSPAPTGGATGDFDSAGDVYQAPGHTGYPASGDLTALEVRSDGSAKLVTTTNSFTAEDLKNSSGTALIIHENANYLAAAPPADSGKRLACGVISAATTTTSSSPPTTSVTTITSTSEVPPPSTSTSTSTVTVTSAPTVTSTPTTTTTPSFPPSNLPPGG